jgi:hypothetical protein
MGDAGQVKAVTAAQILSQIEAELNRKSTPKSRFPKAFIKNDCFRAIDVIVYYYVSLRPNARRQEETLDRRSPPVV